MNLIQLTIQRKCVAPNAQTDDQILAQLSSNADIKDKETRDRYTRGLKNLIADLRSRNVKDFENVANELSSYRRKFMTGLEGA